MPDSPRCKACDGQTYKVAGKPSFKCQKCGKTFPRESFNPPDFLWRKK